ncbi:class I SAM-dependent methyltransferase [Phreatobacter aquaticus]|uniref:Class I SAM-dependent methyltransferase n=1 Tax=Phreatobacter aquaticus TaxID=2570229 RepID=A0A4D7QQ01_9HYPH|nr:class I SAM-dependent methyltransferase [Phreatobacter aquaticus]QCK87609.1 class I SAM-dependent methyltransferase [Phreatobacter aquaticus]
MALAESIAARVAARDVSLFDAIETELTESDRRMLLALQDIVASSGTGYRYLEVGSHRGGSIQPHLLDPRCAAILSLDPRPAHQPDERGHRFHYADNSTARMMDNLAALDGEQLGKIQTFDLSAPSLRDRGDLVGPADFVFIDGEHTDQAVIADFTAVLTMSRPGSIIVFHDAPITYRAIADIVADLKGQGLAFSAFPLPDSLFVIVPGEADVLASQSFEGLAGEVGQAYLTALMLNAGYRQFYRLAPFRILRSLLSRLGFARAGTAFGYGIVRHGRSR